MHSTVQRHQSPERPILHQISSFLYPKIQQRQVIVNVVHSSCVRLPRWSPPVLWRRFEDGLASICLLIHSCKTRPKKVRRRDLAMDESGGWLVVRQLCTAVSSAEVAEPIECGGVRVSLTGFRLAGNTKCMSDIELWKKILHPNLVQLREVFTTKAFGDNCT